MLRIEDITWFEVAPGEIERQYFRLRLEEQPPEGTEIKIRFTFEDDLNELIFTAGTIQTITTIPNLSVKYDGLYEFEVSVAAGSQSSFTGVDVWYTYGKAAYGFSIDKSKVDIPDNIVVMTGAVPDRSQGVHRFTIKFPKDWLRRYIPLSCTIRYFGHLTQDPVAGDQTLYTAAAYNASTSFGNYPHLRLTTYYDSEIEYDDFTIAYYNPDNDYLVQPEYLIVLMKIFDDRGI